MANLHLEGLKLQIHEDKIINKCIQGAVGVRWHTFGLAACKSTERRTCPSLGQIRIFLKVFDITLSWVQNFGPLEMQGCHWGLLLLQFVGWQESKFHEKLTNHVKVLILLVLGTKGHRVHKLLKSS